MRPAVIKVLQAAVLAASAMGFLAAPAFAQNSAPAAEKPEAVIKRALEGTRPDVKVASVTASEITGLYVVQIADGPTVYASPDGKYFVAGDLYKVEAGGFVNLGEQRRNGERAKELAALKTSDMIVFKAKGTPKAVVNVFTDFDCGYCQKLHKEVPQLNAMGIEVRYLAYPRAGIGSDTYQKLVTAWCAKDRQGTLTRFKNRENVPISTCANNPVAAQFQLGERLGVTGTPALVTTAGELIPGYMPAAELAQKLGVR
jgi:thiol:disulfide interchange protein DsbC